MHNLKSWGIKELAESFPTFDTLLMLEKWGGKSMGEIARSRDSIG